MALHHTFSYGYYSILMLSILLVAEIEIRKSRIKNLP